MSIRLHNRILSGLLICLMLLGALGFATQSVSAASKPAKVKSLVVSSKSTSSVKIKWSSAKNSKKYQIAWRSVKTVTKEVPTGEDGGTTKKKTTVTSAWSTKTVNKSVRKYTFSKFEPYVRYEFRVRGVNGKRYGSWSSTVYTFTNPNKSQIEESNVRNELPTIESVKVTKLGPASVCLKWSLASGEEGGSSTADYSNCKLRIYQSTNGSTWTVAADNLSIETTAYTVRKLQMGKKYYFKLTSINKKAFSKYTVVGTEYSNIVSGKTTKIPGLKFKTAYTTKNPDYKANGTYTVKGLMVHSVGAPIQSAQSWYKIFNKSSYSRASVHAFVDGTTGVVWQTLPWTMKGGHAGKKANKSYVGVEMCESRYIKYRSGTKFSIKNASKARKSAKLTYESTAALFAYLCDYFGLNPKGKKVIISHNEWRKMTGSGHWDPEHYWNGLRTGYTMNSFRNRVAKILASSYVKVD